jgi:hypothetical protein
MLKKPSVGTFKVFSFVLAVVVGLTGFVVFVNFVSPTFHACIDYISAQQSAEKTNQEPAFIAGIYGQGICSLAVIAHQSAFFALAVAVVIAWFTWTLRSSSVEQGRLITKQVELAREEFTASHRPEFKIHSVRLLEPLNNPNSVDQYIRVEFVLINSGSGAGTLKGQSVNLSFSPHKEKVWASRAGSSDVLKYRRYPVGSADTVIVHSDSASGAIYYSDAGLINRLNWAPTHGLYFYCWLVYEDDLGGRRNAYFARMYDEDTDRFTLVADPDANQTY